MDYNTILLRPGELFLKGKNKEWFEKKLADNIKKIAGVKNVKKLRSRFVITYFNTHPILKNIFGLISYSPAVRVEKDFEEIKKKALELIKSKEGTFKVETKRSDKCFSIKSPEMNFLIGEHIEQNSNFEFNFEKPDNLLKIEVNQEGAYLFFEVVPCFGGLPTGTSGKVALLIEDKTSLLAGLLFMKRGCEIFPLGVNKTEISLLQKFSPSKLNLSEIKDFKELGLFCERENITVLVSGQTLEKYKRYKTKLTTMRPLIAYSEKEIEKELEKLSAI